MHRNGFELKGNCWGVYQQKFFYLTEEGLFLTPNDCKQSISYIIPKHQHEPYNITKMWRSIKMLYDRVPEPFSRMSYPSLHSQLQNAIASKVFFTPKLQKMPFTPELAKYVRYLDRKDKIKESHLKGLVEAVLVEYGAVSKLEDHPKFKGNLNFSISRNFRFEENELSPYHGEVDYMLWLNQQHFVPVLFSGKEINLVAGMAMAHATMALKAMARGDLRNSGYSIVTTGQEWQMFKVFSSLRAEKTVVYEGRNRFRSITRDFEMIEVVLGLIDESLETEREEVEVLKLAYDVIDERQHMLEAGSEEEARRASPVSSLLRRYFQRKRDQTSK